MDKTQIKLLPHDTRTQEEKNAEIDFHDVCGVTPVIWTAKPFGSWHRVTQRNQSSSSTCEDHTGAEVLEAETGIVVSAKPPYMDRPNAPALGSVPAQMIASLQSVGTTTERLCPSNGLDEAEMDASIAVATPIRIQGSGGIPTNVESIAQAIEQYGAVIINVAVAWAEWEKNPGYPTYIAGAEIAGDHGISGQDYTIYAGENCIVAQNHWPLPDGMSVNNEGQIVLSPEFIAARCVSAYYLLPPKQMTKTAFLSFYTNTEYASSAGECYDAVTLALQNAGIYSQNTLIGALATVRTEVGKMYAPVRENILQATANANYDGILGNVPESNDGYTFRGGGLIQLTGRANYAAAGQAIGIDLIGNPDLIEDLATSAKVLAWFFKTNNIDAACEAADWLKVRTLVNGTDAATGEPNGWAEFDSVVTQFIGVMV